MQMCPMCDRVYDESEYSRCPFCHPDRGERINIVCDDDGTVLNLTDAEFEEFKKNPSGYKRYSSFSELLDEVRTDA